MVEKTPAHLFELNTIFKLRPEAQVVIMLRDGKDVAASRKARSPQGDVVPGIRKWVRAARVMLRHADDPRVTVLRFEDLVSPDESRRQETLEALGTALGERIELDHLMGG